MRQAKPVSYTSEEQELIAWAVGQPGGFSRTVKRALALLRSSSVEEHETLANLLAGRITTQLLQALAKYSVPVKLEASTVDGKGSDGLDLQDFNL